MLFKRILLIALSCILFTACEKEETTPDNNSNNTPPTPSGFTPPTTSYWRINGTNNSTSGEVVQVNILGNNMGINRPFTALNYGYCQLRVFNDNNNLNIRNEVPEGGYKEYFITGNSTSTSDSLRVDLDVTDQNSETNGMYFYKALSGKIYISKLNGKLRYTSDGTMQVTGVKYPDMQSYIYNCNLEFSQVEP
jgi:hypothetical protein